MHTWGDKGVDWHGISQAAYEIGDFLKKWGRVSVRDCKEKWGESRVYLSFGFESLHSITHPGHMYNRYPHWLWSLDTSVLSEVIKLFNFIVVTYHVWLYKLAYKRAVMKRPHLIAEIINGADFRELLVDLFPEWEQWMDKERKRLQEERNKEDRFML